MVIAVIVAGIALFSVFMSSHARHRSPARAAVLNMLLGIASLVAAAALFGGIKVNLFTAFAALTLGLPGAGLIVLGSLLL